MIAESNIASLLEQHLNGTSLYVVDIQVRPGNRIYIYIDSNQGITIDDCARISVLFNAHFDREQDDYALEVSSAGLASAFKVPQQYLKHVGKRVKVKTTEGLVIKGILESFADGRVIINETTKTKGKVLSHMHELMLSDLLETKLDLSSLI